MTKTIPEAQASARAALANMPRKMIILHMLAFSIEHQTSQQIDDIYEPIEVVGLGTIELTRAADFIDYILRIAENPDATHQSCSS